MFKNYSSFIVLYTTSIENTHNFFEKIGIEIKQHESDKVVVSFGSHELHYILNTTEPFNSYKYIAVPEKFGQGIIFYIQTVDIYKAANLIEQSGGMIKAPVFKNHWNAKELLFEDPNGYKFALYES